MSKPLTMLDHALNYLKKGFNVIPVNKEKKPIISWEHYQKNMATEHEVKAWYEQWEDANIGIVTGNISKLAVIDIDTPEGKEAIQEFIPDTLIMPMVKTPRGGTHLYFKCTNKDLRNNSGAIKGCDLRANGGFVVVPPSKSSNGNIYKWFEKLDLAIPLPDLPFAYIKHIKSFSLSLYRHVDKFVDTMFQEGTRNDDIFHVATCLNKGGANEEVLTKVLEILAKNCNPPFPEKEIPAIIKSVLDRQERQIFNLANEVREWVVSTNGVFLSTDVHKEFNLSTRVHKKNVSEILRRLIEEGLIERFGNKNGQFRRIEQIFTPIKKVEAEDITPMDIRLPLGIERYAKIYQSNILIVAGGKDVGKTAFCLDFALLNKDLDKKIRYISSEFGIAELKERVEQIKDITIEEFLKAIEFDQVMSSEVQDAVLSNAINIIDFLEISEGKFYMIAEQIKKIYQKLRKGIVLIALQKKKGQEYARGGELSAEKSRLYVTLERDRNSFGIYKNIATILHCKNRAIKEVNPNGFQCEFKLGGGYYFKQLTDWLPK